MSVTIDGNGSIAGTAEGFQTGDFKQAMRLTAPAGWIVGDGSTIGNVGSGATRANVDTLSLFTLWWDFSNAALPILTSAGGASTRGASAAADWAALKRLTVFDVRERYARNTGATNAVGVMLADDIKSHSHITGITGSTGGGTTPRFTFVANDGPTNVLTGTTGGAETRPATFVVLGLFKL